MPKLLIYVLGIETNFRGDSLVRNFRDSGIQVEKIFGFDGRHSRPIDSWRDDERSKRLYRRVLRDSEIACAEGHFRILDTAAQQNFDFLLVLEDDVNCESVEGLLNWIEELEYTRRDLYVFRDKNYRFQRESIFWKKDNYGIGIPDGTYAYLLNSITVSELLKKYNRFSFSGFVADFPNFYADVVRFRLGPVDFFSLKNVESFIGTTNEMSLRRNAIMTVAHALYEFTFIKFFVSAHKDSGIRGYIKFIFAKRLARVLKAVNCRKVRLSKLAGEIPWRFK